MSDFYAKKYIRYSLDEERNLISASATNMPTIDSNLLPAGIHYVYLASWASDFSDGRLIWTHSNGYVDKKDDPKYKNYESIKEELTELYGSLED